MRGIERWMYTNQAREYFRCPSRKYPRGMLSASEVTPMIPMRVKVWLSRLMVSRS